MEIFFFCLFLVCDVLSTSGSLTNLPEPLDHWMVGTVAVLVNCVLSPVVNVDVAQAAHEQLHRNKRGREKRDLKAGKHYI